MSGSSEAAPEQGFRGPQVCKIIGITYRQLDYWARTNLLTPSITAAKGSGTQRRYSYRDVLELKVIKKLLDAGLSLPSARKAVERLREDLGDDIASANLVISGDSVVLKSDGQLVDLLKAGQGVLSLLPMGGVQQELDAAIAEFHPASEEPVAGATETSTLPIAK
jgi:DNA-binding transcriptional MerR regulator